MKLNLLIRNAAVGRGARVAGLRACSLLGVCLALISCQSAGSTGVKVATLQFQSGGKTILVDRFRPAQVQQGTASSAVLVLHGSGGTILDGPEMKRTARDLALAGHDAYVLHYFNRVGGPVTFDRGMVRHFSSWLGTVHDAVTWMRESECQRGRIGLFGYSLGGFLTVAESFHDPRIAAAVVHAGGVWDGYDKKVSHVPAMLLVHGRKDMRVEFGRYTPALERILKDKGQPAETVYYDKEDHRFNDAALIRVRQQTVAFFDRKLKARVIPSSSSQIRHEN